MNDDNTSNDISSKEIDAIATEDEQGVAPNAPEPKPKKKASTSASASKKPRKNNETSNEAKVSVTVDTSWDEILNYDQAGALLVFGAGRQDPPELDEEQLAQLSATNRERYRIVAESMAAANDDAALDEIQRLVEVGKTAIYARATDRLKVWDKDPRFAYIWSAPHNLHWRRNRGYTIVEGGREQTMFKQKDGTHRISDRGGEELILMKAPTEVKEMEEDKRKQDYRKSVQRGREQIKDSPIWEEDEALEKRNGYRYRPISR